MSRPRDYKYKSDIQKLRLEKHCRPYHRSPDPKTRDGVFIFDTFPHCLKIAQNVSFEIFELWHFCPIFVLLKLTCLVTLFDRKLHVLKNSPKGTIFGLLH